MDAKVNSKKKGLMIEEDKEGTEEEHGDLYGETKKRTVKIYINLHMLLLLYNG
jgi:hypothetical protein